MGTLTATVVELGVDLGNKRYAYSGSATATSFQWNNVLFPLPTDILEGYIESVYISTFGQATVHAFDGGDSKERVRCLLRKGGNVGNTPYIWLSDPISNANIDVDSAVPDNWQAQAVPPQRLHCTERDQLEFVCPPADDNSGAPTGAYSIIVMMYVPLKSKR